MLWGVCLGLALIFVLAAALRVLPSEFADAWASWLGETRSRAVLIGAIGRWGVALIVAGLRTRLVIDGEAVIVRNGLFGNHCFRTVDVEAIELDGRLAFLEGADAVCVTLRAAGSAKAVRVLATTRAGQRRCERDAQLVSAAVGRPLTLGMAEQPTLLERLRHLARRGGVFKY